MNPYNTTITLDVGAQTYFPVVKVKQYDSARTITVRLRSHGEPYDLSEVARVQFRCEKPDGHAVKFDAEIVGEDILIDLAQEDNQSTVAPGRAKCDVVCVGASNEVLSSAIFYMEIVAAPNVENTIASTDAYKRLEDAIDGAERFANLIPEEASEENKLADKEFVHQEIIDSGIGYTLPPATTETLGGVIVGDNLDIDENGVLSAEAATEVYKLYWYGNPTQAQINANLEVINEIRSKEIGTYELTLTMAGREVICSEIYRGSSSSVTFYFIDFYNEEVQHYYIIRSNNSTNYAQRIVDVPRDVFDESSPGAASMYAITTYIDTRIGTTDNLDPSSWSAKYDKPTTGIPSTDLSSEVQASLGLADSALQSIPIASDQVLGGVKVGDNLDIDQNGVLSADEQVSDAEKQTWNEKASVAVVGNTLVISSSESTLEVINNAGY